MATLNTNEAEIRTNMVAKYISLCSSATHSVANYLFYFPILCKSRLDETSREVGEIVPG